MREQLFVVKITSTEKAGDRVWFKKKKGSLFIARFDEATDQFVTREDLDGYEAYGVIPLSFCRVITKFNYLEESDE